MTAIIIAASKETTPRIMVLGPVLVAIFLLAFCASEVIFSSKWKDQHSSTMRGKSVLAFVMGAIFMLGIFSTEKGWSTTATIVLFICSIACIGVSFIYLILEKILESSQKS